MNLGNIGSIMAQIPQILGEAKKLESQHGMTGGILQALSQTGASKEQVLGAIDQYKDNPLVSKYLKDNNVPVADIRSAIGGASGQEPQQPLPASSGLNRFR